MSHYNLPPLARSLEMGAVTLFFDAVSGRTADLCVRDVAEAGVHLVSFGLHMALPEHDHQPRPVGAAPVTLESAKAAYQSAGALHAAGFDTSSIDWKAVASFVLAVLQQWLASR